MTNNVKLVVNGYLALTESEKEEFGKFITEYNRKDYFEKSRSRGTFSDDVKRIMGPTSSGFCPSCGRG